MNKPEIVERVARVRRYIAEYEDAPNWGGPTMYPARPSIADLKALIAAIEELGVERLVAALERIAKPGVGAELNWSEEERGDYWSKIALTQRKQAREALNSLSKGRG